MTDGPAPDKEAAFFTTIRGWGLTRGDNGVIGGVVAGLGARIGMAPVPARLLTVLAMVLLPGVGLLAYAAAWGLLPDRHGAIVIQNFGRGVTNVGALMGIGAIALVGLLTLDWSPFSAFGRSGPGFLGVNWGGGQIGGFWDFLGGFAILVPLGIAVGAVVLAVVLVTRSRKDSSDGTAATPPHSEDSGADPEAQQGASDGDEPATPVPGDASSPAGASAPTSTPPPAQPAPWEPALLPGDPRAGVAPSRGASAGLATASAVAAGAAAGSATSAPAPQRTPAPAPAPAPAYGAPVAGAAAHYGATPPPSAPPRPVKPKVPGPGKGGWFGFLAAMLLSAAGVLWLSRTDQLGVSPLLAWGAGTVLGLGLVLTAVALSGRRLGFLGFLSIPAVIVAVVISINATEIRDRYDADWAWWGGTVVWSDDGELATEQEVEPSPAPGPVDATAALASDYASTLVVGECYEAASFEEWSSVTQWGASTATMRLDDVSADLSLDLTADYTRVVVPEATSVEIAGPGTVQVVWADRDFGCTSYGGDEPSSDAEPAPRLSALNVGAPVLSLTVPADGIIYLEETAS